MLTVPYPAAFQQAQQPDKASQSFIKTAIEGNNAEIEVGKLAQHAFGQPAAVQQKTKSEKGQADTVKQYGAMLVKDHSPR
jgi:predicted outer membrane protein